MTFNPFGPKSEPEHKSGFERLPKEYTDLCKQLGKLNKRSPQNRQIRQIADRIMAERARKA